MPTIRFYILSVTFAEAMGMPDLPRKSEFDLRVTEQQPPGSRNFTLNGKPLSMTQAQGLMRLIDAIPTPVLITPSISLDGRHFTLNVLRGSSGFQVQWQNAPPHGWECLLNLAEYIIELGK